MATFSAVVHAGADTLTIVPSANVALNDTFDLAYKRAGRVTALWLANGNTVASSFTVAKVSAAGVVTNIITVTAAGALGTEITEALLFAAAAQADRVFSATDSLRITSNVANSNGAICIRFAWSQTPGLSQG